MAEQSALPLGVRETPGRLERTCVPGCGNKFTPTNLHHKLCAEHSGADCALVYIVTTREAFKVGISRDLADRVGNAPNRAIRRSVRGDGNASLRGMHSLQD